LSSPAQNTLERLPGRLHHPVPPRIPEFTMHGRVRNERGHHAGARLFKFGRRLAAEHRGQVARQVAGVRVLRLGAYAVSVKHYLHQQGFLVCPVLVDSRLAHAGGMGYCVHAGGVDAALAKQGQRGLYHLLVSFGTAGTGHSLRQRTSE